MHWKNKTAPKISKATAMSARKGAQVISFTRADAERLIKLELTVNDMCDHMRHLTTAAWYSGSVLLAALLGLATDLIVNLVTK